MCLGLLTSSLIGFVNGFGVMLSKLSLAFVSISFVMPGYDFKSYNKLSYLG